MSKSSQFSYRFRRRSTGTMENAVTTPARHKNSLQRLQTSLGNRGTAEMLQTKLKIGKPNDRYEQEADRVAEQVINMPENDSRKAVSGKGEAVSGFNSPQRMPEDEEMVNPAFQGGVQMMGEEDEIQMMPEEEEMVNPAFQGGIQMVPEEEEPQDPGLEGQLQRMPEDEEMVQQQPDTEEDEEIQMMPERGTENGARGTEEQVSGKREAAVRAKNLSPDDVVQRTTASSQQAGASGKLESQVNRLRGGGQPLPKNLRNYFEPRFGRNFSRVRIHTGPPAVQASRDIGAKAFTLGQNVAFGKGQFQPHSREGKKLIAHELTHVVQQGKSEPKIQRASDIVSDVQDPIADQKLPLKDADVDIPGLSPAIVTQLEGLLASKKRKDRKKALEVLVEYLIKDGQIDGSLLLKGKMYYGTSGEGLAKTPGYRTDPVTGDKVAKPTQVRIGFKAFKNVPWLYSSIMHEYMHVLQFQEPVARGTKGQRGLGWLIKRQEVEAYAYEINKSDQTGLSKHKNLILENWRRLNKEWRGLGRASRKLLSALYEKTYKKVKSIVGAKKIPYRPYKGK